MEKFCALVLFTLTTALASAGALKVDINRGDSKNTLSGTATGYVQWSTTTDGSSTTSTGTNAINESFPIASTGENVVVSLAVTAASYSAGGTNITYTYYSQYTTDGWKLASDGVCVAPQDNNPGGQIQMTIAGLNQGAHSLLTYHNAGDAASALGTLAPIKVFLNGIYVTAVTPTIRTNDLNTPTVYLNFTTASTNDVTTVLFAADTNSSANTKNVFLNGFEIDTPNVKYQANTPYPANGDEHANCDNTTVLMQWTPALTAVSNDVYVATDSNTVMNATHASPAWKGTQTGTNFLLAGINSFASYYWRVDEINSTNGVTTGNLWYFRPRHLAFPGAEGYGQFARGGRGGVVIEVTNLNDSGPGSYRAAISASGPRTIVFKVSGVIWLQSPCIVNNGYVTIAGQTAPGDGICIANYRAGMGGPNDVIMRFMHFRTGDNAQQSMDAMSPGSATHSIFDHITSSWSLDVACNSLQSGSVGTASAMTSYQHNIISEPLRYSYHYNDSERSATGCTNCFQPHAFAASISGEIGSYHHNLIAHSTDRNWSLAGGYDHSVHYAGSLDIRNNVVYNWLARTTDGGAARVDYENNYYKPYSANNQQLWLLRLDPIDTNNAVKPQYYMAGNVMEGKNYFANNWQIGTAVPTGNGSNNYASSSQVLAAITNAEIYPPYVTTQSATNAYKVVLSDVGCNLPTQDLIDRRVIGEVLDGTYHYEGTNGPNYTIYGVLQDARGPDNPGFIDSQTDVKDYTNNPASANYSPNWPWPPYYSYNVPVDSDHDGLPDWWEQLRGTNPHSGSGDFSDANADLVGDGFTELERYLNWLAIPHFDCTNGTTLTVDLTRYTRGFTNANLASTYSVFNPTNGTVALSGKNAQFNPAVNTNALGSFLFKVTDNTGFSYTNSINIHILSTNNTTPMPPQIVSQPTNLSAFDGGAAMFTVTADGTPPLIFQWSHSSTNLPNSNTNVLSLSNVTSNQSGNYFVIITNFYGSATSSVAALSVFPKPPLAAWGYNAFGQTSITPGVSNIASIAAGGYHSLALHFDGSLFAWGNNYLGQCDVPGSPTNVAAISAGESFSLAVLENGSVLAWGANDSGQTNIPESATNIISASGGGGHGLALRDDGSVLAWGDNSWGQSFVPPYSTNFVAVAAGGQHSLALNSGGTVVAWGGDLGPYGSYAGQSDVPWNLNHVVAIAAGAFHSLALKSDGTVVGWGDNSYGQAQAPADLTNAVAIAAGTAHSLALRADGTVVAWGDNSLGQLDLPAGLNGVIAIAAGDYHNLTLSGNPPALLRISAATRNGHTFSVLIPTQRGRSYFLFGKNSLLDTTWTMIGGASGNGSLRTLTDSSATSSQRFYQVRVQ